MRGGAPFGKGDGGIRKIIIHYIVVINDLPHSNPFILEMMI